mmetsp:Transcript_90863/g.236724  ORF Transcript_90863/g.236724 Transcript_90863/m.236724 type:complete len:519 (+) Transcript_90863:81-1637(+)
MGKKAGTKPPDSKKAGKAEDDDDAILNAAVQMAGAQRKKAEQVSKAGEEAAKRGQWEKAIAHFTEAIFADPNDGVHYKRRSAANAGAGRYADALADAKVAADLGSKQAPAVGADCACQLGAVLCCLGKLQEALDAYDRGLKLLPGHVGCQQGRNEAQAAMERRGAGLLERGADDVEAQRLQTLPVSEDALGRGFEVVKLVVGSREEPLSFLVSTTTVKEVIITPATCAELGLPISREVVLKDVRFEGGGLIGNISGCQVANFMQQATAQTLSGAAVHGMVGLPFLERYDLDLDRARGEQRLKKAGAVAVTAQTTCRSPQAKVGAVSLPCLALPGNLLGLPVQVRHKQKSLPLLGIIDTSSMYSVINWQAARELGIASGPADAKLGNAAKVVGLTADGTAEMPIVNVKISMFATPEGLGCKLGGISKEEFEAAGKGNGWGIELKAKDLKGGVECGRVNAAVGDALQLQLLADAAVGHFNGGAVLIGQDVLAQLPRCTISAKDKRLWADSPARIEDCPPI